MAKYIVVHQFAEVGGSISIPDTAVGITVSVDSAYRVHTDHPCVVNVCYMERISEARREQ